MAPNDRNNKLQKIRVIYKFKCPHINCPEEYIGESGRTLGDMTPSQSRLLHHCTQGTTEVTINIKQALYIWVNDPSLNRNLDKYQPPHIWDHILQDTPAL